MIGRLALAVALTLVAAACGQAGGTAGAATVLAEPYQAVGPFPFTDSVANDGLPGLEDFVRRIGEQGSRRGDDGSLLSIRGVPGSTPGLYGGTGERASCDAEELAAFLTANRDKASAWASVHGISPAEIEGFVDGLTAVVLARDTLVTNHGYRDGVATPRQSLLQAGTAVLVDRNGVPRVRCQCGNPLLRSTVEDGADIDLEGDTWPGLTLDGVTAIGPTEEPLDSLTVVDIETGGLVELPLDGDDAADPDEDESSRPLVPELDGASEADAVRMLEVLELVVTISRQPSDTVAAGVVIGTEPPAGAEVRPGDAVTLMVSEGPGPAPTTSPDDDRAGGDGGSGAATTTRDTTAASSGATSTSGSAGSSPGSEPSSGSSGSGSGSGSSSSGGSSGPTPPTTSTTSPTTSSTTRSRPTEVTVPSVVGTTSRKAENTLREVGFAVEIRRLHHDQVPAGTVVDQSPAPGASHKPGGTVTIHVSLGPQPPPDLTVELGANPLGGPGCSGSSCSYTVTFTVHNKGKGPAGATVASVQLNGAKPVSSDVPRLQPGESVTQKAEAQGGNCFQPDCIVTVVADVDNRVAETDENNNSARWLQLG